MMNNTKRNRGGRMNSGGIRPDKRKTYQHQDRPRSGSQMNYNEKNVNNDSGHKNIYMNERFIHVVLSLVGCVVQVQVKAGSLYEGILWTCSENGDVVLEMAHKVGDCVSNNHPLLHMPSRESVADKIIINRSDIVTISVSNVDLDYAVRDNFTDMGISKYNGEVKEMRQLEPWKSEGGDERALGEVDNSSACDIGWDADIMFDTNNRQFNVGTLYDDSLEQYTTKLNKENTEEYRRREEEAQRLAAEIEAGDQHKHRVAIENSDGDDEEETFSAVVRPNESQTTGAVGSIKYIPPNKRSPNACGGNNPRQPPGGSPSAGGGNMPRQSIGGSPSVGGGNMSRQSAGGSPSVGGGNMSRQSAGGSPSVGGGNMLRQSAGGSSSVGGGNMPRQPSTGSPSFGGGNTPRQPSLGSPSSGGGNTSRQSIGESPSVSGGDKSKQSSGGNVLLNLARSHSNSQQSPLSVVESVNGDERSRLVVPVSTAGPMVRTSVSSEHGSNSPHENKQEHPTHGKKSQKGRHQQIMELKEFSSNFKLDENADTSKDKDISKDGDKKKDHDRDEMGNRPSPSDVVQKKDSVSGHQAIDNLDNKESVLLEKQKDVGLVKQVQDAHGAVLDESHSDNMSKQSLPLSTEQHQVESLHVTLSPSTEQHQDGSLCESLSPSTEQHQEELLNESQSELAAHSKLNPNAKVFSPKSFQRQSPPQIPTPPHPQTNSPSMPQHLMMNLHPQPILPATGQQYMTVPAMVISSNGSQPQKSYSVMPKRAIVSVNSDYTSSAVQAATGQPLLAQNTPPAVGSYMFFQQMIPPQPTGYQLGQMMPMPQPMGHRFISPTSIQGAPPSMQPGGPGMDQNSPSLHAGQLYLANHAQQVPMAAHMSQAAHFTAHPSHLPHVMANSTNNQQQNSPMIPPVPPGGASGHHHPAPSPVNMQNQQPINPGPHPQPSGTPQSHPGYPQGLAPSPHNPTSPQNMPIYPYVPMGHPSMQMQVSSGGQQFSIPQHGGVPTSVAYNMTPHAHHAPHMPQLYMVPPHPTASGQMNPHIQFPGHSMMGPGSVQPQMMSQTAVPGQQAQNHGQGQHPTHHMQYTPQVHNAGGQPYQPTQ